MNKEKIQQYYQKAVLSDEDISENDIRVRYILKFLREDKNIRILDAGCGNGKFARKLKQMHGGDIHALDICDVSSKPKDFTFAQASIDQIPYPDDYFDFVYSTSVIYYLDESKRRIQEFARVLRKNGKCFFTAHIKYSLFTALRKILRFFNHKSMRHLKGVRFYSTGQYVQWCNKSGFQMILRDGYRRSFLTELYQILCRSLGKEYNRPETNPRHRITSNSIFA